MFINIHTHKISNTNNFEIISSNNINNNNYFSVGIHPWNIEKSAYSFLNFEKDIKKDNVLAIGEIGLDRAISNDIELQKKIFFKQLEIAKKEQKPIIIHCVRAYSDFQEIIKSEPYKYIFHGFNANIKIANYLIYNGSYLSFGEKLISSIKLQQVFKKIPINKIFLETDESNIDIKDIYIFVAELLDIDITELKSIILSNFKTVFNLDVRKLAK